MTTPPLPVISTPRRSRLWLWLTLGGLALVITIGTPIYLFYRLANRFGKEYAPVAATLPSELAAAKKEGLPTTVDELRPNPPVKDADNAAPLYRKLTAIYRKKSVSDAEKAFLTSHLTLKARTSKEDEEIRAFLTSHAAELALTEQAAQKPSCDFARSWSKGFETTLPELPVMRAGARLLMLRAALRSDENQPVPALHDVALAAKVAEHSASDPNVIAALVKTAIQAIANRRFVEILSRYGDNPAVLPAAREAASALSSPIDIARAFSGEMVLGRVTIQNIKPGDTLDLPGGVKLPADRNTKKQMKDAWESRLVANWRTVQKHLRASNGDWLRFEREQAEIQKEEETHRFQAGYELNAILDPVYLKLPAKILQAKASDHLRQEMIAVLEYKQKNGRFPDTLNGLPETPAKIDPFTNQPLLYRKVEKGFVLYSVSNNRKDDGGSTKSVKVGDSSWPEDIVFSYL